MCKQWDHRLRLLSTAVERNFFPSVPSCPLPSFVPLPLFSLSPHVPVITPSTSSLPFFPIFSLPGAPSLKSNQTRV